MYRVQALLLSFLAYLALQLYSLNHMEDRWEKATVISARVMAAILTLTLFGFIIGTKLWPLGLLVFSPLAFVYQLGLFILWVRKGRTV